MGLSPGSASADAGDRAIGPRTISYEDAMTPDAEPKEAPGLGKTFTNALSRGWRQNVGLVTQALPALAYSIAGNEEDAQRKLAEYAATLDEIQKTNPAVIENFSKIGSIGDAVTYLAEAVGENLPSMVPGVGMGGAGMVAGRALARNAASKAAAGLTGLTAGSIAGSAVQNIPETFADVAQETGQQRPGVALAFGGLKAGLDAIPSVMALKRAFGPAITDKIAGNILKRMGVGAAEQFVAEGATEGAQEALDIVASKYVDENRDLFTQDNLIRIIDAGLKGGLGGAVVGAGTGALQRPTRPGEEPPPPAPPAAEPAQQSPLALPYIPREMSPDEVTRARAAMGVDWEPTQPNVSKERFPLTEPVSPEATDKTISQHQMPDEAPPSAQASDKFTAYPPITVPQLDEWGDPHPTLTRTIPGKPPHPVDQNPEQREVETQMRVARKSAAYQSARHYTELTHRIGEDPGEFVARYVPGVTPKQFQEMPIPVRDKLVEMATAERGRQQATAPTYNVQDTSGEGPTSAAPAPMGEARAAPYRGAAENPNARVQPTSAEIEGIERRPAGEAQPKEWTPDPYSKGAGYSQQAVGGSERPFQGGSQDSSGLDFGRDQQGQPVDSRAAYFEQRAKEQAARAQAAQQEEMRRQQEEYNNAREARRRQYADAESFYADQKGTKYSSAPKDLDKNGDFPTDQFGFVISTGGGPMRFTDGGGKSANQKAALWIKQHGQRRSKYQVLDRANHPSGKGIGIVVTGRNEPPGGAGPGKYGVPATTAPSPEPPPKKGPKGGPKPGPAPKPPRPLSTIPVTIRAFEGDSGKVVSYRMRADKALPEIDKNIETAKALLQCLKS